MAQFDLSIINGWTKPDNSGNTYFDPLNAAFSTAAVAGPMLVAFAGQSSREGIEGRFRVPQSYVGTPSLIVEFAATATGNAVTWDFEYSAVGSTESFSATALASTGTEIQAAVGGAARDRLTGNATLAAADFAAGDEVVFRLLRDGANTSDTYAGTVWIFNAVFRYQDT